MTGPAPVGSAPPRWNRPAVVSISVMTDEPDAIALTIDAYHWALTKLAEHGIAASVTVGFPEDEPERLMLPEETATG